MKTIRVAAAVIRNNDKIFAAARGYGDYKGQWEFPGGKIEEGETPQQALVREITEELAAEIEVGELIHTIEYDYPEFHLSMDCFWCTIKSGKLTLLEAEAARWLTPDNLRTVQWLPADLELIDLIEAKMGISAAAAKKKLIEGNKKYIDALYNPGDISKTIRQKTAANGQHPYAIILCCSDSREIPEAIFSAGIGELFVIRVAGNVVDPHQLGSIEYAADHLGCKLIVVLGHDHCGAVEAAIHHDPDGHIKYITDDIREAIGSERDEYKAACLNVLHSVKVITENTDMLRMEAEGLEIVGAIYHIESGEVSFL